MQGWDSADRKAYGRPVSGPRLGPNGGRAETLFRHLLLANAIDCLADLFSPAFLSQEIPARSAKETVAHHDTGCVSGPTPSVSARWDSMIASAGARGDEGDGTQRKPQNNHVRR